MTSIVLDASVTLAWCLPDEQNAYADRILDQVVAQWALVPAVWALEVANALTVGMRLQRINGQQYRDALVLLTRLSIRESSSPWKYWVQPVVEFAGAHRLSAYDAAYLELALRHGVPLATLDQKLEQAARAAGVAIAEKDWP